MMICPHCQSENREGAKFCNECGSPLLSSADKTQVIDAAAPLNTEDPMVSCTDETSSIEPVIEDDSDSIDNAALPDIEEAEDKDLRESSDEHAA